MKINQEAFFSEYNNFNLVRAGDKCHGRRRQIRAAATEKNTCDKYQRPSQVVRFYANLPQGIINFEEYLLQFLLQCVELDNLYLNMVFYYYCI